MGFKTASWEFVEAKFSDFYEAYPSLFGESGFSRVYSGISRASPIHTTFVQVTQLHKNA